MNDPVSTPLSGSQGKVKWPVVALVVAGGLLLGFTFALRQVRNVEPLQEEVMPTESFAMPAQSPAAAAETDIRSDSLSQVSSSTEIGEIEKDLTETDLAGIDAEMGLIEQELK